MSPGEISARAASASLFRRAVSEGGLTTLLAGEVDAIYARYIVCCSEGESVYWMLGCLLRARIVRQCVCVCVCVCTSGVG